MSGVQGVGDDEHYDGNDDDGDDDDGQLATSQNTARASPASHP